MFCVSLTGYTCEAGINCTNIRLQTLQGGDFILLLKNNFGGVISSVLGDRHVKSDEKEKIEYIDATILNGLSMVESLPHDGYKFDKDGNLEDKLKTSNDSDIRFILEVDKG